MLGSIQFYNWHVDIQIRNVGGSKHHTGASLQVLADNMNIGLAYFMKNVVLLVMLHNARDLVSVVMGLRMSRILHSTLLKRVIHAPINLFFDITPLGNLINGFTEDMARCDRDFYKQCE